MKYALLIALIIILIANYTIYFKALHTTYKVFIHEGRGVFYNDRRFTTKADAIRHAIPFYYTYLYLLKMNRTLNNLK